MRFVVLALFVLTFSFEARATGVLISSGVESNGDISETLSRELVSAGAPDEEAREEIQAMHATSVECESTGTVANCSLMLSRGKEKTKVTLAEGGALFRALEQLQVEGVVAGSCVEGKSCRLSVSSVLCHVNTDFPENAKGKYACGIVGG